MTDPNSINPNAIDLVAPDFTLPDNYYDANLNLNLDFAVAFDPAPYLRTSNGSLDVFSVPHNNGNGHSDSATGDLDMSEHSGLVEDFLAEANLPMHTAHADLTNDAWNYPRTHQHSAPVLAPGELWESGVVLSLVGDWNGDWVTMMNTQSQPHSPSAQAGTDLQPPKSQTATPPISPSKAPKVGEVPNVPVVGSSSQLEEAESQLAQAASQLQQAESQLAQAASQLQQADSPMEDVSENPPTMDPAPLRPPTRRRTSPRAVGRSSRQAAADHAARQAAAGVSTVASTGQYLLRVPWHLIDRICLPPTTAGSLCDPKFGDSYICIQLELENIPPHSQRQRPCAHFAQGSTGANGGNNTCKRCLEESSYPVQDTQSQAQSAGGQSQAAAPTPKTRSPPKLKRFFDYTGVPVRQVKYRTGHINCARNPSVGHFEDKPGFSERFSDTLCNIHRIRYQRFDLNHLHGLHEDVIYEKNNGYCDGDPYQQEFTRIELAGGTKAPKIETRSALCGFCEHIHFYELKNSSYSQHMSHVHGIYTNNYLTPNPAMIGKFNVAKQNTPGRTTNPQMRLHDVVICPACNQLVEIKCWRSTLEDKPLSNYLRHFKEKHRKASNSPGYFEKSEKPLGYELLT